MVMVVMNEMSGFESKEQWLEAVNKECRVGGGRSWPLIITLPINHCPKTYALIQLPYLTE